MSPEQVEGKKLGPPTDVYGLGTILYAMLCLRPPHRGGSTADTLRRVVSDDVALPRHIRPELPRDLEANRLRLEPRKGPDSTLRVGPRLAEDLSHFLEGKPTKAQPANFWERTHRFARRHSARLWIFSIAIACACWTGCRSPQTRNRQRSGTAAYGSRGRTDSIVREPGNGASLLQYVQTSASPAKNRSRIARTAGRRNLDAICGPAGPGGPAEFTWHYLLGRCHTERQTLTGHVGEVYNVEFSPDGTLLASAGKGRDARIWSTSSGQLRVPHRKPR